MLYPFEKAFYDYFDGKKSAEIIVHCNKGEDEVIPVSCFFRTYDEMPDLEKKALNMCSGKILDIGAGAGSHALYLQEKGYNITGIDIMPGFVDIMKKRGLKKPVLSDIRDYQGDKFDTLLMLMNGIGFTCNFEGMATFLQSVKKLLKPGGQIILDSSDLLYLYTEDDGSYTINLNENYYGEVEYIIEYEGVAGTPFNWLFVDYENLAGLSEQAGFSCELIFEDDHFNYLARLY